MTLEQPPVHSDPATLGGAVVFTGTRVPVQTLWDYLEAGDTLDAFLADYPTVVRAQAIAVLESAKHAMLNAHSH